MKFRGLFIVLATYLSMFFTAVAVFGQVDRRILVGSGFKQLPDVVNFLATSPAFDRRLTEKEREQLSLIRGLTEHVQTISFFKKAPNFEEAFLRSGVPEVPEIMFSDDGDFFKLEPDQPERAAVTSEIFKAPIWFNLRILNAPNLSLSYLEVLQILFHEMGHKIGAWKHQESIDSLGAKFIEFLRPFYHEAVFGDTMKVEILSLPFTVSPVSFRAQWNLPILLQEKGLVNVHFLDLSPLLGRFGRYTPDKQASGNINEESIARVTRMEIIPFEQRGLNFRVRLRINYDSQLNLTDPHIALQPMGPWINGRQGMSPTLKKYTIVESPSSSENVVVQIGRAKPESVPQYLYLFSTQHSGYPDFTMIHRVSEVIQSEDKVRVEISNSEGIEELHLSLESPEGDYFVSGKRINKNDQLSAYEFKVPSIIRSSSSQCTFSKVIVNGEGSVLLPKIYHVKVQKSSGLAPVDFSALEFFDGATWRAYTVSEKVELPPGPVRFRLSLPPDHQEVQVRLKWIKGNELVWRSSNEAFGIYSSVNEEVLNVVKTSNDDKSSLFEFESYDAIKLKPIPTYGEPVIFARDSGKRILAGFTITSMDLHSVKKQMTSYLRIFKNEYLKIVPTVKTGHAASCSHLFP